MNPWEKYAAQPAAPEVPPWEKYGAAKAPEVPANPMERLPSAAYGAQPAAPAETKNADDIAHRLLGIGEAGAALATGAVGGAAGQLYGIGKTLTSGKFGTQQGIREGERAGSELASRLTYQPRTQTGQQLTEAAGRALEASKLEGLPVEGPMLGRIGEVPRGVLATGEGAAALGQAAGKGVVEGVAAALPAVDAETQQLARQAHQMGFRLTPEQVVGGKYSKIAGESLASVPLSGGNTEFNKNVFLRNLSEQAGIAGGKPTRTAFREAKQNWGRQIGDLNKKYDIPIGRPEVRALRSNGAGQLPDVANVVDYYAGLVEKSAKEGVLPGATFRRINTKLNKQIAETSNGDLKHALGNLQEDLLDMQHEQMMPADREALQTARRHYAVLKTIEPLAAKSPTGDIAPSALLGALTSTKAGKSRVAQGAAGDLGSLADIGSRFLKEPKSSGTAERRLIQGIPSSIMSAAGAGAGVAGGAATLPAIAGGVAGTYGLANLYNRAGPAITRALIEKPPQ